ncbi:hypothetical protein NP233_g2609 [Leucocoprinus birnbaumii]|uniref:Uncharacterized protein n=1 Tax=Leucocoprinus birnbaumii TaxID=56174 RepID=A0AAD5VYL8_9AGAR|nr:hypothetical protein NP233_g2609 [Leucocoprinus birnbaumii]
MTILENPSGSLPHPDSISLNKKTIHSTSKASLSLDRHKRKLYSCGLAFILLEIIFLIFAYYTLLHPIPLQNNTRDEITLLLSLTVTLTEFKAGITAAAVVWHTVACFFIKDVIAAVCSAEFMTQFRRSGALEPGKSDRVSTVTSGIFDSISHFLENSASREFRLAFVITLVLMVVGPLGSGTVTTGSLPSNVKISISIANVTSFDHDVGPAYNDLVMKANSILRLDGSGNALFGYKMSSGDGTDSVLIPWPNMDLDGLPDQSHIVYKSDIVRFHYQCSWVPLLSDFSTYPNLSNTISMDDELRLMFQSTNYDQYTYTTSEQIYSGSRCGIVQLDLRVWSAVHPEMPSHRMAFLFYNTNYLGPHGDVVITITPPTLPSNMSLSKVHESFSVTFQTSPADVPIGMDFAILDCDPQDSVVPGEVTVTNNSLVARQLPAAANESAMIGNFLSRWKNDTLPSWGFSLAFQDEETAFKTGSPTQVLQDLFLRTRREPSMVEGYGFMTGAELEPLSLDEINRNMDRYAQSASKAFLDGSRVAELGNVIEKLYINQTGEIFFR